MAVKKKTSKKVSPKAAVPRAPKTSKKVATSQKSANLVDRMLVKISPQLQGKIGRLMTTLDETRAARTGDLSLLASKILVRAQEVSQSLRGMKKKKGTKK